MKTTEMREPWISVEGVLYDFDQGIITQTQALHMIKKYVLSDYERHHSHSHCPEKDSPCGIQGSHRCCLCEEPITTPHSNHFSQANEMVSQEVGWETSFDVKFKSNTWYSSEIKQFISTLLADKAKVLESELKNAAWNERGKEDGYLITLEEVLSIVTRILR